MSPIQLTVIILLTAMSAWFATHYAEAWYRYREKRFAFMAFAFVVLIGWALYMGLYHIVQTGIIQ